MSAKDKDERKRSRTLFHWYRSKSLSARHIAVYITDFAVDCFLVRKESRRAKGLIVLGVTALLAACENGGAAFAEYAGRTSILTGPTGNVSSRRGTGLSGGPGARGGGSQSDF